MEKVRVKKVMEDSSVTYLSIEDLKPGYRFTRPVFDENKNLVILPGSIIRQKDIERYGRWGIKSLHTQGNAIMDKGNLLSEKQGIKNAIKHQRLYKSTNTYESCLRSFDKFYTDLLRALTVERSRIDYIVNSLYNTFIDSKTELIEILLQQDEEVNPIVLNSVNCTIISIIIGSSLKLPSHKVVQLATGALLHDIGWVMMPQDYLVKKDRLTEEEWDFIKTHPIHSYSIILNQLKYHTDIAEIALYHHENWDGTGYPKKIKGLKIPVAARIVAVADAFTAMLTKRVYRNELLAYLSLKTIMGDVNRKYDPDIVKALLNEVSLYPVGSYVLLNNNTVGYVTDINTASPLRPKVKVIMDYHGNEAEEQEVVDLNKASTLFIRQAINPRNFLKPVTD
ncbi:MAG: HD-GYP domain-containing protein [Spirochaetales bacterium]|nr:HD-GYP domain-containing protein [Spirochaetales bacterium]